MDDLGFPPEEYDDDEAAYFEPRAFDDLLSLEEAAKRLRITPATLKRWAKQEKFPQLVTVQEQRTISYTVMVSTPKARASDVRAWLESHGQVPRPIDRQAA